VVIGQEGKKTGMHFTTSTTHLCESCLYTIGVGSGNTSSLQVAETCAAFWVNQFHASNYLRLSLVTLSHAHLNAVVAVIIVSHGMSHR
jgi:hypothetical protein